MPYFDAPADAGLVSGDGHAAQVLISLAGTSQDDYLRNYDELAPTLESDPDTGVDTDVAGAFAVFDDVNEITSEDLARAEMISMPIVLILALLIFGSVVAASMPALVGLLAMVGALALVRVITNFTDVSIFSVNVISLLGIGLAIDYALFVISRFREELALLPDDDPDAAATAVRRTMSTAGRTVLFSGLTVAAAMSSLLIFPQAFLKSMGYGGMAAVLVAMVAALTVLPATLRLLGRRVDAGRLPWRRHRPVVVDDTHGRWAALARGVMRRPWLVIGVTVTGLLLIASPFLGATWGSVDYKVLPKDAPAHVAAEKLTEFGPETSTAELLLTGASEADVSAYAAAVAARRRRARRAARRRGGGQHPVARQLGGQLADRAEPGRGRGPAVHRPGLRRGPRRRPVRGDRRPDRLRRLAPAADGSDRGRRDAGAAVPGLRLPGAARQGGRDEPGLDHRLVRRRHLDLRRRPPRRTCSASRRRASWTRRTRS